ncbi:histidinol-phosphatase (PHP family) [Trichococcus patagoniensis]|uniref:Histidinol-phosphatase n=1 Tax=Trichococcus patagoniensis TaxID=382641 RepID=A0A2T5IBS3_9LACT|nr:PHP domain-containing protein [Trichococcus patagoniensis]PTQ81265.1 histidinol-phosphatase (PHP family) [Trichococcus patagoniensis]
MGYYDQHMHTYFSPDSAESFENYLEQTDGLLVTTEHLDFHDAYNGGVDTVLNYAAYSEKIAALNALHDGRIRRGIEVGYTPESHDQIISYLEGKAFDVILLSVHQNGRYDYLQPIIDELDPKAVMQEYFELCAEAVRQVDGANVFAHFDYGIRRLPVTVDDLREFEPALKGLLAEILAKDMALELNTRSMYEYKNSDLYRYMVGLYLEMGGSRFSLGSDAHSIQKYRYHFDDAIALLRELGVTGLTLFKDGIAYTEKI